MQTAIEMLNGYDDAMDRPQVDKEGRNYADRTMPELRLPLEVFRPCIRVHPETGRPAFFV